MLHKDTADLWLPPECDVFKLIPLILLQIPYNSCFIYQQRPPIIPRATFKYFYFNFLQETANRKTAEEILNQLIEELSRNIQEVNALVPRTGLA